MIEVTGGSRLADPEEGFLGDVVDLDRYPVDTPGSQRWCELVAGVRGALATDGAVSLPGFLRAEALAAIAAQLRAASDHVPIRRHSGTVYARDDLEAILPADDPRRVRQEWYAGHVTRDMIPSYEGSHRLYVAPAFKRFIAACVGVERVYEYADPIAGLVATILPPGGQYPWHYDTNEFVVTIMIQKPEAGGRFDYCKDLRTAGDENLAGLGRILEGDNVNQIRTTDFDAGDLQLFLGRYSLHRVGQVEGELSRHVLVLSYAEHSGVIGPLDRTRRVYGRVTEAHLVAAQSAICGEDGLIL